MEPLEIKFHNNKKRPGPAPGPGPEHHTVDFEDFGQAWNAIASWQTDPDICLPYTKYKNILATT